MSPVTQAAVLVAFPVAASTAGAAAALRFAPGPKVVSGIQHFAAGVVIAALVGEVLPDLRHEGQLPAAALGFTLGAAVVLALAAWGRRLDQKAEANPADDASPAPGPPAAAWAALPVGMLVAVGIDLLIDGLLVGLGATLGARQGLIITIALTLEILFLSLSLAAEFREAGLSETRAVLLCTGLGLLTAVGAITGAAVLAGAGSATLAAVLAFGAAALLYLAVEELLVEAHEVAETTALAAMFFLGFLIIYVLAELGG